MEFTGERFIPDNNSLDELTLEHKHRYLAIMDLVKNKRVADIACGEGFGSDLLAKTALSVVGIDISQEAIEHALATYKKDNLRFQTGDIGKLSLPDKSVDIVVSFETIEHVSEKKQAAFLAEANRILAENGLFVISTPNKEIYSDLLNQNNRFHKQELYRNEFMGLLKKYFQNVIFFEQGFEIASVISSDNSSSIKILELPGIKHPIGKYIVAVCSRENELLSRIDISSMLHEVPSSFYLKNSRILSLQNEAERIGSWAHRLEKIIANQEKKIVKLESKSFLSKLKVGKNWLKNNLMRWKNI
jgi:ubiquinone/menaquinone biosynthesis C-methylase UbiE